MIYRRYSFHATLVLLAVSVPVTAAAKEPPVEFNRDIRPILADNCYACHGPDTDKRKAKLRLDTEDGARANRGDAAAVVPGKPNKSLLVERITSTDRGAQMPPPKSGKALTKEQVALLTRWVEQGGAYQKHWSLIPPKRHEPPAVADAGWGREPIDRFILARLEKEGLKPSPEADRRTLIRRLSFDLTGLPPTPEEVEAFVNDKTSDAYEKVVDRLLASKHFGERMALYWLDLVRFADTAGYHSDNHRDVTLYRDYVINAFNDNKRFDQFTREQLAGDLLPDPTDEQRIASGYNRLLMTTEEGGAQPKEYTAKYAADRVRNVSTVWLASTLGCSECHSHKFDPFTHKEFYQFAAFFADLKETAVGRQEQMALPSQEQRDALADLDARMADARKKLETPYPAFDAELAKWEDNLKLAELRKLPKPVLEALLAERPKRDAGQKQAVAAHFRTVAPSLEPVRKELADLQKQKDALNARIPKTLVSVSVPPRVVRVLPRGNWLDDSGEVVTPNVPVALPPVKFDGIRPTRLDLADWMVSPYNPLTSRVFVNRLWKLYFGQGLVKSLDDFGTQGALPTHPELLDWLAVEFRESGWDTKKMIRRMVTSRTYRQSSATPDALKQRDPYNTLLARQTRFRLDAEMVRDNALAVGGLLVPRVGGPSVKPYQPPGYWAMLNFPKRDYVADKGEDQYRRGLYSYWQRTFPHPSLIAFDAPSREECTVERPRSNTPLQALVLLNDPSYVEAARAFAERILRDGGKDFEARVQLAFRQALGRKAESAEVAVLSALYEKHKKQYEAEDLSAVGLLQVGDRPIPQGVKPVELAAWTSVARVLLNLHETITRN